MPRPELTKMDRLPNHGGDGLPSADLAATEAERVERIRLLNDSLREGFPTGDVMITPAVRALPQFARDILLLAIQHYSDFDTDNDPYGEHDFGSVEFDGHVWFWKIDYYDLDHAHGSPDPADPDVTRRVLTIMRADEY